MSLPKNMRWEQDLIKDIRFHDKRDNMDNGWKQNDFHKNVPSRPSPFKKKAGESFGKEDQYALLKYFLQIKNECEFIMEIGVDRDGYHQSSTKVLIENKLPKTVYLGIDVEPKKQLDNHKQNIYTVCCKSQDYDKVRSKINELKVERLGFLMIDGWHSINQVLQDWEYTDILSKDGIVAFHDTRYHPGPHLFTKNLNKKNGMLLKMLLTKTSWIMGLGLRGEKDKKEKYYVIT